jgi:hypothetical protein
MSPSPKRRFWRRCRVYFRRFRILVLLVTFALLCLLVYLDSVGLPAPARRRLVEELRTRGLDLEFSRLRLRLHGGLVADNLRFGQTAPVGGPTFIARQASVLMNLDALRHLRLQVDGLDLREGRLEWPTNDPEAHLELLNVEGVQAALRLGPGDEWNLQDFRARFAGVAFTVSATITNASSARDWLASHKTQPGAQTPQTQSPRQLGSWISQVNFPSRPEVRLIVSGDARQPDSFHGRLSFVAPNANTPWGNATNVLLLVRVFPNTNPPRSHADESLAWWTNAMPWNLEWSCHLDALQASQVDTRQLICDGGWNPPMLSITNLHATFAEGQLNATATLDAVTREAGFRFRSDADPAVVEAWLSPKTRRWLSKFSWHSSPHLASSGRVILPAWTNRQPNWQVEVRPTVQLSGQFAVTNGAYLGLPAQWACSHFTYTNLTWELPDLTVGRPEGVARLAYREDDGTRDYHWHLQGAIHPSALRPYLASNQLRGFDLFEFTSPVSARGEISGRLYDHDRIGFRLHVAATNFSVRGQGISTFESELQYTNRYLEFLAPSLTRGAQVMNAAGVAADFDAQRIHFTNGFSMAEPQAVADAIGPRTGRTLAPYRFTQPPVVHVEGYAPLKTATNADLHFAVEGGPFEWWKFKVPRIEGNVHWLGSSLLLTNVNMDFYGGYGEGFALFDFVPNEGSTFGFALTVTNSDLHSLMAAVSTHPSRLEGVLDGTLVVTQAVSTDWNSWYGSGRARLVDGFIWDIPVFGFLSPILNNIIPGLGNSRATDGTAEFIITNSVVYSDSLNVRSPLMRLQYQGGVDFQGRVDARVEAELLRDAWLIGRLISFVLKPLTKMLEYKVGGTLSEPKPEPVFFVPRLLLSPLHPFRSTDTAPPVYTNVPPPSMP